MSIPSISVIIPTLNAENEIVDLLTKLAEQSFKPDEILVVDSSSDDATEQMVGLCSSAQFYSINRDQFNHGLTRDIAFRKTKGDIVCFLTQDAIPVDRYYLEHLLAPFEADETIALVSGRQLPKKDARRFEQLVRQFNYPDVASVRSEADIREHGIKTFFASDVCSAYRRSAYIACGGFPKLETNEDMFMAAKFISCGLKVAYEPSAAVYHSHNLTPKQQFDRNRVVGRFLESHSNALMNADEIGEGGRLAKEVSKCLLKEHKIGEFFAFGIDCSARLLGNRVGRFDIKKLR